MRITLAVNRKRIKLRAVSAIAELLVNLVVAVTNSEVERYEKLRLTVILNILFVICCRNVNIFCQASFCCYPVLVTVANDILNTDADVYII